MKKIPVPRPGLIILILAAAFAIRLINIDSPPVGFHSWRQSDTAAMARNFYENRYNFLYPQIDWGGVTSGYVESEFPIYSFSVATLYKVFGQHDFIARLAAIAFSLVAIYFVYLMGRKLWGERCGLWSAVFFAFLPLQIFISRAIMPESLLVMSVAVGMYCFYRWYEDGRLLDITFSGIFISAACLIKPPTLYLGLPLAYLAWRRCGRRLPREPHVWLFASMIIVPLALWYYHAHRLYLESGLSFGVWGYGSDKWGNWDLVRTLRFWKAVVADHAARQIAYIGIPVAIASLFLRRIRKEEVFLYLWLAALLVFVMIVAKGVMIHTYYLVPALIPVSLFLGKLYGTHLGSIGNRFHIKQVLLLVIAAGMAVTSAFLFFDYIRMESGETALRKLKMGDLINRNTRIDDMVLTVDGDDPTLLYLSHRKGGRTTLSGIDLANPSSYSAYGIDYIAGFDNGKPFFISLKEPASR